MIPDSQPIQSEKVAGIASFGKYCQLTKKAHHQLEQQKLRLSDTADIKVLMYTERTQEASCSRQDAHFFKA